MHAELPLPHIPVSDILGLTAVTLATGIATETIRKRLRTDAALRAMFQLVAGCWLTTIEALPAITARLTGSQSALTTTTETAK